MFGLLVVWLYFLHFDLDLHWIGQRVIHRRLPDQLLDRHFIGVALDLELPSNFAVAAAAI